MASGLTPTKQGQLERLLEAAVGKGFSNEVSIEFNAGLREPRFAGHRLPKDLSPSSQRRSGSLQGARSEDAGARKSSVCI